ncbi:glycosyltransferase family 25 protein [Ruegeria arenilitoris]|uniref:glycosyltransferase family 25 protein n=1 Tax=Ruegeria arenilitoris TaxID=1173585 RepID=UPI00147ED4B5|nr:glycosyltransferase family 25 protein [Ruegeria arenilitoris]
MVNSNDAVRDRILELFERIYVINLPYRTDRKRQIEKQLNKLSLSFSDKEVILFEAVRPESEGKWPTVGARGCFMSHVKLLKNAKKMNYRSILILEDDADWSDSFLSNSNAVVDELSSLKFDYLHGGDTVGKTNPRFKSLSPNEEVGLTHFVGLSRKAIYGLVPYLETMAEREAGHPLGGPMHVDGAYNWFRKDHPDIQSILAVPSIAEQRPSRTDVHALHWTDRAPVLSSLKNALRPLVNFYRKNTN